MVEKADPTLLRLMDDCKRLFGARLVALRVGDTSIGWDKWERQRAVAVTFERGFDIAAAQEEWQRIKAQALKAGDVTRRKPSLRKPGLLP